MIRSAITISLVEEARGGPFVFWHNLSESCRKAKSFGYDAVEIFPSGPDTVDPVELRSLLSDTGLSLAAVGTGAGWVKHRLHLTLADNAARIKARDFIRSIIDFAGPLGAPAIIGSMQGRSGDGVDHSTAMEYLTEALDDLGEHAKQYGVPLIFEPLNRYETNMANTVEAGLKLLQHLSTQNVVLLADLFHMNIEEANMAASIRLGGKHIGHVHFVDSNRRPAGSGHLNFSPIVAALHDIGYDGFASAEALPLPDSDEAARLNIESFHHHFRPG
jgi:sugar phosphate isomerase/epimerase